MLPGPYAHQAVNGGQGVGHVGPQPFDPRLADRRRQIKTLFIFNQNVTEVCPDVEYRVRFDTPSAGAFSLVIILPQEFPHRARPAVKLYGVADNGQLKSLFDHNHAWLDKTHAVVGAPGLNAYGLHSDLGRVVQAIKREFELNPPKRITSPPPNHASALPCSSTSTPSTATQMTSKMATISAERVPQNSTLAELDKLSEAELTELKTDGTALRLFCNGLDNPIQASVDAVISQLESEILGAVETSSQLGQQLKERKQSLDDTMALYDAAKADASVAADRMREAGIDASGTAIGDRLRISVAEDEAESEVCAEKFLAGQVGLDEFLSTYLALRTSHHANKAKVDKLEAREMRFQP